MRKFLVPCDGSDNALRALRHAASLANELSDVQLELLNVQDLFPRKVYAVLSEQEIARWQAAEADLILLPATKILADKQVPYAVGFRVGSPAGEIAQHVRDSQCHAVIMGTRGLGSIVNLVIGSVASQVVHLVEVPVTLLK